MGQRAVLLLSELLLLLTASRTLLAVSFPEDSVPLDVVDAHCEYTDIHTQVNIAEPEVYIHRDTSKKTKKTVCCLKCIYFTYSDYKG